MSKYLNCLYFYSMALLAFVFRLYWSLESFGKKCEGTPCEFPSTPLCSLTQTYPFLRGNLLVCLWVFPKFVLGTFCTSVNLYLDTCLYYITIKWIRRIFDIWKLLVWYIYLEYINCNNLFFSITNMAIQLYTIFWH